MGLGIKNKIKLAYQKIKSIRKPLFLGDLNRTKPFSEQFGYDRGGPVDRYYIENFLKENAASIKGKILEIGDNAYTHQFGKDAVKSSDILHINNSNPKATLIGDLTDAPHIPSDSFDCIILTQTLQLIFDCQKAIDTCYRILKPGGVLLLTVPGISNVPQDEWGKNCFWCFTEMSVTRLLSNAFKKESCVTDTYGNVLSATAFLYGMGLPELKKRQMDVKDKHYQLIITAVATK